MKNRREANNARRSGPPPMIRNSTAEFLVFTAKAGDSIEVRYEDETIWLPQKQMAALFDVHSDGQRHQPADGHGQIAPLSGQRRSPCC